MSTVDTSQWSKTLASIGSALSTQLQDKMLKKADADGNGSVDKSEFKAAMAKLSEKTGMDLESGSDEMFTGLDTSGDGNLNTSEIGGMLQSLFAPQGDTASFMQARGDEAQFNELDADGNGSLTMAELGILPAGETVTTTTVTTTTVVNGAETDAAGNAAGSAAALAAALQAASGNSATETASPTSTSGAATAVAAANATDATQAADPLATLMKSVDKDGDGKVSGSELTAFVTQLSSQMEAASRKYNETALAAADNSQVLDATA